jgi:hypothetical protein
MIGGRQIRHCDVRYAIIYAKITAGTVELTHLFFSKDQRGSHTAIARTSG